MSSTEASDPKGKTAARNGRVALICVAVFAAMVGAAFASVPLYRLFCQVTGFGGTVSKAESAPTTILDRKIAVRFDANVRNLPWTFTAEQVSQDIRIGETGMAFFKVTNNSDKPVTGHATYNVLPEQAGGYFAKLQCFCFSDQTLQPGQSLEFPVIYYVDPGFVDDINTRNATEVTLSYTFFPSDQAPAAPKG